MTTGDVDGPRAEPLLTQGKVIRPAAVAGSVLLLDLVTKLLVRGSLAPGQSVPILGDFFRLTYVLNPGAAFGIHVGEHSRLVFLGVALVVLGFLFWMFLVTPAGDRPALHAIALVVGGAAGNVVDRIASPGGVTDFFDVGFGALRWPVFNVADIAITIGAILLFVSIWGGERRERANG